MSRDILAIIPARGGSKGIPEKNICLLNGRPLISYTFDAAKASQRLTKIILTTDSAKIAEVGRKAGIEIPFLRPAELAMDETPTLLVIRHSLNWLAEKEGYIPDIVVNLQPTAPLRKPEHIDEAIGLLITSGADSVVSVTQVPGHFNPHWQFCIKNERLKIFSGEPLAEIVTRRQELTPTYTRNGAIYAFWRRTINETGSIYGNDCKPYIMEPEISVNIDSLDDWVLAEERLKKI